MVKSARRTGNEGHREAVVALSAHEVSRFADLFARHEDALVSAWADQVSRGLRGRLTAAELQRQTAELQTRLEQTRARLEGSPPLSVVEQLNATWEATRAKLRGWNEALAQWTGRVEQERTRLAGLRDSWLRSREGAAATGAPKVVLDQIDGIVAKIESMLDRHHAYVREHGEDMPEIRDWRWRGPIAS